MFSKTLLVFVAQAMAIATAAIFDGNCTVGGKYTKAAFQCENKQSDAICSMNYGPAAGSTDKLPTEGGDTERPLACFGTATEVNQAIKNGSISNCAKFCGYCCETANYDERYSCENVKKPTAFNSCDDVTEAMCKTTGLRSMIVAECPKSCGFCNSDKCMDIFSGCTRDMCRSINVNMQAFAKDNCARTCETCDQVNNVATTKGPSPIIPSVVTGSPQIPTAATTKPCQDNSKACAAWVRNGFCKNQFYTDAARARNCAASCNLCHLV